METELPIAFAVIDPETPAWQVRVNFGMTAGREATQAEVDVLAQELLPLVDQVTIVAERRHAFADGSEVLIHQVTIEADCDPDAVVEIAERWARACFAARHIDITEP